MNATRDTDGPRYQVERRDDEWAVVTEAGDVVSTHAHEAEAVATRTRLASSREGDVEGQHGAYPDNVGG